MDAPATTLSPDNDLSCTLHITKTNGFMKSDADDEVLNIDPGLSTVIYDSGDTRTSAKTNSNRKSMTANQRRRHPVKPKGSGPGRPLTADRRRPYPCQQCSSRFGSKMELEEHQNSHTGQKPFQCDICNAKFNRRSTLWNHKRIHSDTKPFTCSVCFMTFKWKNSLKCHTEMHLRKSDSPPDPDSTVPSGYMPPITYASAKRQTEELAQEQDACLPSNIHPNPPAVRQSECDNVINRQGDSVIKSTMSQGDDNDTKIPFDLLTAPENIVVPSECEPDSTEKLFTRNGKPRKPRRSRRNPTEPGLAKRQRRRKKTDTTTTITNDVNGTRVNGSVSDSQTFGAVGSPSYVRQTGNISAQSTPPSDPAPSSCLNGSLDVGTPVVTSIVQTGTATNLQIQTNLLSQTAMSTIDANLLTQTHFGSNVQTPTTSFAGGSANSYMPMAQQQQAQPPPVLRSDPSTLYTPNFDLFNGTGGSGGLCASATDYITSSSSSSTPQQSATINYYPTQYPAQPTYAPHSTNQSSYYAPTTTQPPPLYYNGNTAAGTGQTVVLPPPSASTTQNGYGIYGAQPQAPPPQSTPTQFMEGYLVKVLPYSEW